MVVHVQFSEDILHVGREPVDVLTEVRGNVIRVIAQLFESVLARIEELISADTLHCFCRVGRNILVFFNNCGFCIFKGAFEPAENRHGNDYITVFVRHIGSPELVCDAPDKVRLSGDINRVVIPQHVESFVQG